MDYIAPSCLFRASVEDVFVSALTPALDAGVMLRQDHPEVDLGS